MFSTVVIAVAGVLLLVATVIPGVRLYWPQHRDPVRRSDLGIALMTGALIAFAVLAVQIMIQIRSQRDANDREQQTDRAALLLQLGRSANLAGLDLHEKDLSNAYMKEKDLSGANLEHTSMTSASLQDSILIGANLSGATLDKARLQRADLRYADLGGASLVRAELNGVNLNSAELTPGVDLSQADLSNASAGADLRGAVLANTKLVGAGLASANLQGADLTGADLQFADLRGADLRGANLVHAVNLEYAKDLSGAKFDGGTRWPPKFTWPVTEVIRPTCTKPMCALPTIPLQVSELQQRLTEMRERLASAADEGKCLPGWLVEDRPGPREIRAYPPGDRAGFSVSAAKTRGTTMKHWAQTFTELRNVHPMRAITGSARPAYAVRSVRVENGHLDKEVHVWFVRSGGWGFHAWAEAPPALFSMFEADFTRLFRAVGVEGDLFPLLRGGKDTCTT
jgi:uncharacterized protein YjbI with pentapeptide repeats